MKKIIYIIMCMALLSSCHIYRNYQRPEDLPVDSLYQDMNGSGADDSLTLGDLPWQEVFQDTLLQDLRSGEQYRYADSLAACRSG